MTKIVFSSAVLAFAVGLLACHQDSGEPVEGSASASPAAADGEPAVEFEPAYPSDVSREGLAESDVAQHQALHSHGDGEVHAHDEEGHTHGDEEDQHDGHDH